MTIYLVVNIGQGAGTIFGAFSTLDLAQKHVLALQNKSQEFMKARGRNDAWIELYRIKPQIEEYKLDEGRMGDENEL